MKVLLLQDIEDLGEAGEIISVKNGYGRNYLIPRGLVRLATSSVVKAWEEERRQKARKLAKHQEDAEVLAKEIEALELVITAKVGEENRIFGTITSQDIAQALAGHGIMVDRKQIQLEDDIRVLGVYTASAKIHPEVTAEVKVRVDPED
ncbi:MAG: 50S ribosomal protein L9 [Bacteroidetes bacterium]|nr:50S ribosomal protein L9 [Bacteroidota bacterium]MCH8245569.1 50S ribosomal protein L9 [Bacteroidota bacterium]